MWVAPNSAGLFLLRGLLPYLETAANLLELLERLFSLFSKRAFKSLNNQADFDSAACVRQVFSFCSLTPVGYWPVLNFEGAWNKPTLCTFTCIVGSGNCKNAYDIGDIGCAHLGGDRIDDRSI